LYIFHRVEFTAFLEDNATSDRQQDVLIRRQQHRPGSCRVDVRLSDLDAIA
jgi:hypothetical protein